jgi:hypothetical protein
MAYNFTKGPQKLDDIVASIDPEKDTKIDFGDNKIDFIVGNNKVLSLSSTSVSSSNFTGNGTLTSSVSSIVGNYLIPFIFGDASDGNATLDGTGSVSWANRSGVIYTMTRDALCGNLTINSGVILRVNNYLPYATGTLTNDGTIESRGNDASGVTPGAYYSNSGTWSSSGGSGGSGSVSANGQIAGGSGGFSIGGGGGKGGDAGAFTGGAGNTSALVASTVSSYRTLSFLMNRKLSNGNNWSSLNGSGGGGGGAGSTVNGTGGGGGSGVGICAVACNTLINNGTIQSVGGRGADGVATGAGIAGGGGGGSGGPVFVFANKIETQGTIQSVGGGGGAGANGGTAGTQGSANSVLIFKGS